MITGTENDKRLARITLKAMKQDGGLIDHINECALAAGATDFEARFIELASHWGNDLMDACFEVLGLAPPEGITAFNRKTHDAWYAWFCLVVDQLPVDTVQP